MTMTDRERVIEGLMCCQYSSKSHCDGCPYCYEGLCEINDCTADLTSDALDLLQEQNWISVRDRLPNCNGCYLVWRPHFYTDKGMPSICYFDGQNTWHDSYGVDFTRTLKPEDVSHWKPLPEQP